MPAGYYVTAFDGARFKGFARGPFATHGAAIDAVDETRDRACAADPFAHFYAWGTARIEREALPEGPMNRLFQLPPAPAVMPAASRQASLFDALAGGGAHG